MLSASNLRHALDINCFVARSGLMQNEISVQCGNRVAFLKPPHLDLNLFQKWQKEDVISCLN